MELPNVFRQVFSADVPVLVREAGTTFCVCLVLLFTQSHSQMGGPESLANIHLYHISVCGDGNRVSVSGN